MRIYPAIDIIDGACVRLVQGDYSQKTKFAEDPCEVALRWQREGGEFVHIVDLDGAKSGEMPNLELICRIANTLDVPIEVGGGIRTMEAAERYLENGVERVIIGTSALSNPDFVKKAVEKYGDRIAVGIDAKDGMVAVNGWEEVSSVSALDLAKKMEELGVAYIIYTDIATDGMLKGPNKEAMAEMVQAVPKVNIIASGGVTTIEDVEALIETGVEGAIIGKALYTDKIDLAEAVEKAKR
ncbi:MAG: 1-(5-phosphoribosyl)-5-[(5-phosphoribosylamino)methylideneamino]imidazole-4-carboxamide isomerase [Clostridia bacterium]|nr:1-(5-phosphoribosyl)-5-[(5-phosphoribosylamino)methylideneamino]imidazole-4-carboxamide isomerase [Clostridia bacterium]